MNEPTLNSISDYHGLKGEKRRVVTAVIAAGLVLGTIFVLAKYYCGDATDEIKVEQTVGKMPLK